jgi:hypothetical protein
MEFGQGGTYSSPASIPAAEPKATKKPASKEDAPV